MEIKKEIKISEVLSLLNEGKSREEIAQHFELSNADLTVLFKHPSLKGKKAKKQRDFIIVDDITETAVENNETYSTSGPGIEGPNRVEDPIDDVTEEPGNSGTEGIPTQDLTETPWNN